MNDIKGKRTEKINKLEDVEKDHVGIAKRYKETTPWRRVSFIISRSFFFFLYIYFIFILID